MLHFRYKGIQKIRTLNSELAKMNDIIGKLKKDKDSAKSKCDHLTALVNATIQKIKTLVRSLQDYPRKIFCISSWESALQNRSCYTPLESSQHRKFNNHVSFYATQKWNNSVLFGSEYFPMVYNVNDFAAQIFSHSYASFVSAGTSNSYYVSKNSFQLLIEYKYFCVSLLRCCNFPLTF